MASVDDRIVRMEFDNASFERKLSATLVSLGELDKALKFTGAQKGLSDVSAAAGKVNLGTLGTHIESISSKFLALGTIAVTALSTIASKAISYGGQMAKNFFTPIKDGFGEYEKNMNSIQTIMANTASKGTTMDQVTAALDKLNAYSDKTIYNFGEMAKNIGTFTAAGVDLDTSVQSIKGIANIAAMSGSTSEQASSAMYQLSQAIATGSLKLMDWNSVVNAGMGGEAFKSALFETGKAMGTLTDVPMAQSFKQWEDSGNSFRDSLQDEWITAEVLTTTLAGFTGDLTEEMLIAKGYSQQQADNIIKTAKIAQAAATEVKTFSQLVGTVKEAIGTGWADSFKIVIGNFTEAKALWTEVNNSISGFVGRSAKARNELLQGWKDMGGRTLLIESLQDAFIYLTKTISPVIKAFREIFPPMTARRLMDLTESFADFVQTLKPSQQTLDNLKRIFKGFFSILSIGWTVLKEGVKFIGTIIRALADLGGGTIMKGLANFADFFTGLQDILVKGGGIKDFFAGLASAITAPIPFVKRLGELIADIFTGFDSATSEAVGKSLDKVGARFAPLKTAFEKIADLWKPFQKLFNKITEIMGKIWTAIKDFAAELGAKIGEVLGSSNFDAAIDALNVGLLGGIVLTLKKFLNKGLALNINAQFESGGLFDKINKTFESLTGTLQAFQANLKADTLMKIAGAIGILTASVLVLSLIDSAALTKSLTAMAVGFGQLMGAFAIITKMNLGPTSAASFSIMSVGMIALSTAILILSAAVKTIAKLSWEDLAKGLAGVTAMLTIMVGAAIVMAKNAGSILAGSAAMGVMAVSLGILAGVVKLFAMIPMGEMAKGFIAVSIGLGIIAVAMKLMPKSMVATGVGLLAVAVSLNILALAMKSMAEMDWGEMAKGMVGIAGALVGIALAMKIMPPHMAVMGVGLIAVGIALNVIAKAMKAFGGMSWGEIGKGLVVMAGALLILAVACKGFETALPGAAAILVVSVAMTVLVGVLESIAAIPFGDLLKALGGLALALITLGAAALLLTPAIGPMMALGAALIIIGGALVLFGAGIFFAAKGLEILAELGPKAGEAVKTGMEAIGAAIPALVEGFGQGIIDIIVMLGGVAPLIAETVGKLLSALIDVLLELVPKMGELIQALIDAGLAIITEKLPEIALMGVDIILGLLEGIRDRIDDVVIVVGEIITEFINALTEELPKIVDSVANLITTMFIEVAESVGQVAGTMLFGIGIAFLRGFLRGVLQGAGPVGAWFMGLARRVLGWIGNVARTLWQKGSDFLSGLWNGIWSKVQTIANFFTGLAGRVIRWVGSTIRSLVQRGRDLLQGLWNGIIERWTGILNWFRDLPGKVLRAMGSMISKLKNAGLDLIQGLWNGIIDKWDSMVSWVKDKAGALVDVIKNPLKMFSPSRVFYELGENIVAGMANAIRDDTTLESSAVDLVDRFTNTFQNTLNQVTENLGSIEEFSPTITPVLDLTKVQADAQKISDYIQSSEALVPALSFENARLISATTNAQRQEAEVTAPAEATGVKFEQNIYAPEQLSTADIYKQTRNQIAVAKEELSIP